MIEKVGLPPASVFLREARTNAIQHNKFMVLLKGQQKKACRGMDRLDQHLRRRHPRPDQCRPLGARA